MWKIFGGIAGLGTILSLLFAGYLHMFTDIEAAELITKHDQDVSEIIQAQHEIQDRTEIYRSERKIDELKERIRLNPTADLISQLEWQSQIEKNQKLIECIKSANHLCY